MALPKVIKPKSELTVEKMKTLFPTKKASITEELVEYINEANSSGDFNGDELLDSLVTYRDILSQGQYSLKAYVTAIKFCSYLVAEEDNATEAYKKARADEEFVQARMNDAPGTAGYNALSSAAARYKQTKLVRDLLTVTHMPFYLMFRGESYKALAVLADEMHNAAYSKDRIAAADKLLTHVKPPENVKVELDIGPTQEAVDLNKQLSLQLAQSVAMQKSLLEAGVSLKDATKLGIRLNDEIIDAEVSNG